MRKTGRRVIGFARNVVELGLQVWPQFVRPMALELLAHRPVREILPGVHHWTAVHPRIRVPVDSYYLEFARVLVDPVTPREGLEWFDDRDPPEQIVLTNRHHLRHSPGFAEAFGIPIRAAAVGLHEFADAPAVVEGFAFGDELAPGVTAHEVGAICPDDGALHIRTDAGAALAFADAVQRPRGGGLTFVPGFLLGDDPPRIREELRASLRRLLAELEFDHLLFAHGDPLIGDGTAALRRVAGDG